MTEGNELTMHVHEFSPMKESLKTWVSLLALNGVWGLLRPRALIHSCNHKDRNMDSSAFWRFIIKYKNELKMQQTCQKKHGSLTTAKRCTQTFRARRLLLISAPSRRVWRSALDVSAPLSFPARSIRENLPCIFPFILRMIWNTAWLRDEWALADVWPDVLGVRQRRLEREQITSVNTARNEQL